MQNKEGEKGDNGARGEGGGCLPTARTASTLRSRRWNCRVFLSPMSRSWDERLRRREKTRLRGLWTSGFSSVRRASSPSARVRGDTGAGPDSRARVIVRAHARTNRELARGAGHRRAPFFVCLEVGLVGSAVDLHGVTLSCAALAYLRNSP